MSINRIPTNLVSHKSNFSGSIERTLKDKLGESVSVKDFGAKGDGVTDDTTAFTAALATNKTVCCVTGESYKLSGGLTIDLGKQSFIGHGSTLDFSSLTGSMTAITLVNTNSQIPADLAIPTANRHVVEGLSILGDGKAGVGAAYSSNTTGVKNNISHSCIRNSLIYGFGIGISVYSEGYIQSYDHVGIGQCGIGLNIPPGGSNYGERISFKDCAIYDNAIGAQIQCANGAVHFTNCSLDYNLKTFNNSNSAVVDLHSCWWECNDAGVGNVVAKLATQSAINMFGGRVMQNGTPGSLAQKAFFETDSDCVVTLHDSFLFNLQNTSNVLDSGSGRVIINRSKSYGTSYLPSKISESANNKLFDGGFTGASVQDFWYLADDTSAITNRFTGANSSISISNTYARSGTQSLKLNKTAGGANGAIAIAVPVSPGSRAAFSGWYKKPAAASSSGTIFVTTMMAHVEGVLSSGLPNIISSQNLDTIGIGGTDSLIDWTNIKSGMDRVVPPWANYFIVYFNAQPFLGTLYLDDFNISVM
jgi:hypothetical protein